MDYQAREAAHAQMARTPVPDGTSCPEKPTLPCYLTDIAYATNSASPRMYALCDRCGTHYAFLLPRRSYSKNPTIEGALRRERESTVFVEACESIFSTNGIAQKLAHLIHEHAFVLRRDVIRDIERHVERDVRLTIYNREQQLTELTQLVRQRLDKLSDELWRTSYREVRRAAEKAQNALNALRGETKREEQRLAQRRAEYAAVLASINEAREQARLAPLPVAELPAVDAAVLCDRLAPSDVIYALVDPAEPKLVRYVGRTADPVHRYRTHCTSGADAVTSWAQRVMEEGRRPAMILLERCERDDVEIRESFWIHHYRDQFQADLNRSIPRRREQRA